MLKNFSIEPIRAGTDPAPARLFPLRLLAIAAVALCLSPTLFATSVRMTFVGVNGTQMFGVYVGPYSGTLNGTLVDLFCVDFANEVTFGQQWDANLTPITSGANLSDTRYGAAPGALQLYQQAAWLTEQFALQTPNQYGDIHATIWQLFNPATAPVPSSSWWLEQAQSNYTSANLADFRIVTNTGPVRQLGQVQEFLTLSEAHDEEFPGGTQSNEVPEPSLQWLVGLSLIAASCLGRKLRRAHSHI